jgi:hypothetical protein
MLPKFYQTHLKSQLSLAEYLLLQILINVLEQKKILSEVFPIVNNYNACILGDREFCGSSVNVMLKF